MNIPNSLKEIAKTVANVGGTAFLTGGAVRDFIMSNGGEFTPKDFDVEVHGLAIDTLKGILEKFGKIQAVGESFGVIKLRVGDDEFDFSMPRRESKSGNGHKGFMVEFDPTMTVAEACSRRDFTINAAMVNLTTGELVDPFNAKGDIAAGVLRHTSPAFADDPLRPMRAVQFAARFGFTLAPETAKLCESLKGEFKTLPVERVWEEWSKWATKGRKPSAGLRALVEMGWHTLFPELGALHGLAQEPDFHPEGDAMIHTGLACDAAAEIGKRDGLTGDDLRVLMFGTLCHDFGKPASTKVEENGRITSKGHDTAGEVPTVSFLTSIGAPKAVVEAAIKLVVGHMFHVGSELNDSNVRRLSNRLAPETNIKMLARVIEADHSGRAPLPKGLPCPELLEIAERLVVAAAKPKPILTGKHLIDLGFKPGREMGDLLKKAFELQLAGHIANEEQAIEWASTHKAA